MNKEGIIGAPVIVLIMIILVFFASLVMGLKLISIINIIPNYVWYILIAVILFKLFGGKK